MTLGKGTQIQESLLLASTDGVPGTDTGGRFLPLIHTGQRLHVIPYVWNPDTLAYEPQEKGAASTGGAGDASAANQTTEIARLTSILAQLDVALSTRNAEATQALIKAKTDNLDVALSTVAKDATVTGVAKDATLTGGTAKSINRGGAKGATVAADITSTAEGVDHQALDVQSYHGGAAIDPRDVSDRAARVLGKVTSDDGALASIGTTTDAAAVGNGSVIALIKQLRTLLNGGLPALSGGRLPVDASGVAVPVTDNGGSVTVDAPVATPVAARLSDGAAFYNALKAADTLAALTNLAQMNGQAIAMGSGVRSVGTQRVTVATDDLVPVSDNGGSLTVDAPVGTPVFVRISDGAAALVGQKAMAASLPVVIASDQGRLNVSSYRRENNYANLSVYAEAVAGIIAETAITLSKSVQYAAASTGTSIGPTTGKEWVICGIVIAWVSTSTTANTCRVRLRVNPAGAATTASPIAFTARIGWESATFIANEAEFQPITFTEPIIIPNGGQLMATLACVAANGTLDIQLIGYERTP